MNEKIKQIVSSLNAEYPLELENRHPHVLEKIATLWEQPSLLDQYFETLIVLEPDRDRQGFAPSVIVEIFRMQRLHSHVHQSKAPTKIDPWELVEIHRTSGGLSMQDEQAAKRKTREFLKCAECADCNANKVCPAVEDYLRLGVPVDTSDEAGLTALMLACHKGNEPAVEQLLKYGANVRATADGGYGVMHWAALGGNPRIVGMLINQNADLNALTRFGLSPLLQAATKGHFEACRLLIAHGASVNQASNDGWTPLHKACANGHVQIVKLLLEQGADKNVENASKNVPSPLALAVKNHHDAAVELLS